MVKVGESFGESLTSKNYNQLFYLEKEWWRRRESNPRPKIFHIGFYIHSLNVYFSSIKNPSGGMVERLTCKSSPIKLQVIRTGYPARRRPCRIRRIIPAGR